jgi:hypothetical protein
LQVTETSGDWVIERLAIALSDSVIGDCIARFGDCIARSAIGLRDWPLQCVIRTLPVSGNQSLNRSITNAIANRQSPNRKCRVKE